MNLLERLTYHLFAAGAGAGVYAGCMADTLPKKVLYLLLATLLFGIADLRLFLSST